MSRRSTATDPRREARLWRRPVVVRSVPAVVLLTLGMLELLQDRPLWYDEAYTRLAAGVPVTTLLAGMWHRTGVVSYLMDVPPSFNGPYYLLMHPWVAVFGSSAFSLRLPGLLCAVGAVAVAAEIGRRIAGPGAGLLCGLLLATGPLLVAETTQARDYGPALLALCLCAYWLPGSTDPGRPSRHAVAAAVAAGLLHWFTIPVVLSFALWAWLQGGASGRRTAAGLVVACVPTALLVGWSLAGGTYGAPTPPPVGAALPLRAVQDWAAGGALLTIGLVVLATVGLVRSRARALLVCWVVVPLVLVTGLELVRASYFPRYLLFALAGLVVAAGVGVALIRGVWVRRAIAALLVGLSLSATFSHLHDGAREPVPAVVALLARQQVAGEPIVPADGRVSLDLETYLSQAPRLRDDLVLPPVRFTGQTTSDTVWLVRVVLHEGSLPVVEAEQRLLDAGWIQQDSTLVRGASTDLRVERWSPDPEGR